MTIYKHILVRLGIFLLIGIALNLCSIESISGQPINTIKFDLVKNIVIDTSQLDKLIQNVKVVGIGEGTHGDHESQVFRKALIYDLIKRQGFDYICIEEFDKHLWKLNQIIHLDSMVKTRQIEHAIAKEFYYWLWMTDEFVEIIQLLHSYNLTTDKKVSITGVDFMMTANDIKYSYIRDSAMAGNILKLKADGHKVIYLAHNYHVSFQKDDWNKWAGEWLKEKLGPEYYSIGILFSSGCFNASYSNFGIKTFCVERLRKLNKLARYFEEQDFNYRLIDFNKVNDFSKVNKRFYRYDYNWGIGAGYSPYYKARYSYLKQPSVLKSWDGVVFVKSITESKNFQIPGNFLARSEIILSSKSLKNVSKDSFTVTFHTNKQPFDSTFTTGFFITPMVKKSIYNNSRMPYEIPLDFSKSSITFPIVKKVKRYNIGFYSYGYGQIAISDFKITGDSERKIIYNGVKDFKFTGGKRFDIKYPSLNEMLIFSLDKP